jgi:hypothetical protein
LSHRQSGAWLIVPQLLETKDGFIAPIGCFPPRLLIQRGGLMKIGHVNIQCQMVRVRDFQQGEWRGITSSAGEHSASLEHCQSRFATRQIEQHIANFSKSLALSIGELVAEQFTGEANIIGPVTGSGVRLALVVRQFTAGLCHESGV